MEKNYITETSAGELAPWLTMVHGMTQDHRVFDKQVAAFKDTFRLLLIDLPGHGLARDVGGPYGHLEMMNHVRSVIDDAGIKRSHFWATHTGTAAGLLLAVRKPKLFCSLILEGAVISGHKMPYVSSTLYEASQRARLMGVNVAMAEVFKKADWFKAMRANPISCRLDAHWRILSDFSGAPWTYDGIPEPAHITDTELKSLTMPAFIYNGQFDLDDFFEVAERLEAILPNSKCQVIPDAGGFPAWEYPDRVNGVVRNFLNGLEQKL